MEELNTQERADPTCDACNGSGWLSDYDPEGQVDYHCPCTDRSNKMTITDRERTLIEIAVRATLRCVRNSLTLEIYQKTVTLDNGAEGNVAIIVQDEVSKIVEILEAPPVPEVKVKTKKSKGK
jgi:hypothetical protein